MRSNLPLSPFLCFFSPFLGYSRGSRPGVPTALAFAIGTLVRVSGCRVYLRRGSYQPRLRDHVVVCRGALLHETDGLCGDALYRSVRCVHLLVRIRLCEKDAVLCQGAKASVNHLLRAFGADAPFKGTRRKEESFNNSSSSSSSRYSSKSNSSIVSDRIRTRIHTRKIFSVQKCQCHSIVNFFFIHSPTRHEEAETICSIQKSHHPKG